MLSQDTSTEKSSPAQTGGDFSSIQLTLLFFIDSTVKDLLFTQTEGESSSDGDQLAFSSAIQAFLEHDKTFETQIVSRGCGSHLEKLVELLVEFRDYPTQDSPPAKEALRHAQLKVNLALHLIRRASSVTEPEPTKLPRLAFLYILLDMIKKSEVNIEKRDSLIKDRGPAIREKIQAILASTPNIKEAVAIDRIGNELDIDIRQGKTRSDSPYDLPNFSAGFATIKQLWNQSKIPTA